MSRYIYSNLSVYNSVNYSLHPSIFLDSTSLVSWFQAEPNSFNFRLLIFWKTLWVFITLIGLSNWVIDESYKFRPMGWTHSIRSSSVVYSTYWMCYSKSKKNISLFFLLIFLYHPHPIISTNQIKTTVHSIIPKACQHLEIWEWKWLLLLASSKCRQARWSQCGWTKIFNDHHRCWMLKSA